MKNRWNFFSLFVFVLLLLSAIFCGICAVGAAFRTVPWLQISSGILRLLIIGVIIWFLGYLSGKVKNNEDDEDSDIESETEAYDSVSQVFRKSDRPVTFVEDKPNDTSTPNRPVSGSKNPPKNEDVNPKPGTQTQKQTQPKQAAQAQKQTQSKPAPQTQNQQTQQQQGKQEHGNAQHAAQPQEPATPKKPVAEGKQNTRRDISHFDMFPEDSKK